MNKVACLDIEDVRIGDSFELEAAITAEMVDSFISLSGDCSPLHTSDDFAANRGFQGRVVHGMLLSSLISTLVGVKCPGKNALISTCNVRFLTPTYIGNIVRVTAVIDQISLSTNTMVLKVAIENLTTKQQAVSAKLLVGFTKDKSL